MLKTGFAPINSGRLMVFPIEPEQLVSWAVPKKYSFAVPVISKLVMPYFAYKKSRLSESENIFKTCSWKDIAEAVRQRQNKFSGIQILHDEEFLKWRASGFRNFFPEINAMENSDGSYALFSYFKPYYNVYEWNCKNADEVRSMFSILMKLASEAKAKTIQVVSNSEFESKSLSSAGFIRSRSTEKVIYFSRKIKFSREDYFYFTLYDTDLNL